MDISYGTPGQDAFKIALHAPVAFPKTPAHNESVSRLLGHLAKENMEKNLQHFSSFHTRYYKSEDGKASAAWLRDQVNTTVSESGASRYGATVEWFPHPWGQNSIIARIPGLSDRTVVIGAHQDSTNFILPSIFAAPGADDDGSGTVTILEALRVLLESDEIVHGNATNTVEFHWYSAEEGGLLGSQAIFKKYEEQQRNVKAMLQQDMTGYVAGTLAAGEPESVGIITDFVDPGLTDFMKEIVTAVCSRSTHVLEILSLMFCSIVTSPSSSPNGMNPSACSLLYQANTFSGYACSDHASARKAGYPSAFVIESSFENSNKNIHSTQDTIDKLDFNHMLQHAKLTLAAAYELAFADL